MTDPVVLERAKTLFASIDRLTALPSPTAPEALAIKAAATELAELVADDETGALAVLFWGGVPGQIMRGILVAGLNDLADSIVPASPAQSTSALDGLFAALGLSAQDREKNCRKCTKTTCSLHPSHGNPSSINH